MSIGFSRGVKLKGNVNRILDMHEAGLGCNAIVGHFKDEGVNISHECVNVVIDEVHELSRKAVTKRSTKKAIKAIQEDKRNGFNDDPLFA